MSSTPTTQPRNRPFATLLILVLAVLLGAFLGMFLGAGSASARVVGPDLRPGPGAEARSLPRSAPLARQLGLGQALPVPYAGTSRQVITVRADCASCSSATLQAWDGLGEGTFLPVTVPIRARIGAAGVGVAAEGSTKTPLGTWDLPGAFGLQPNPGTALPYFVAGPLDYWDGRSGAATYNTHVRSSVPIVGEHLLSVGWVYNYAVVMGVNPNRTPYGGSAFFLHVTDGRPTAGCVAIDQGSLVAILRWLDPAARPQMVVAL